MFYLHKESFNGNKILTIHQTLLMPYSIAGVCQILGT